MDWAENIDDGVDEENDMRRSMRAEKKGSLALRKREVDKIGPNYRLMS